MNKMIHIPKTPNFLRVEIGSQITTIPISDLDDDELDALAKAWRFALYENRDRTRSKKKRGFFQSTCGEGV